MKTIIHVDNSVFFRKQVKLFLEASGFAVEGFSSAQEAGLVISTGIADMIIMGLAFSDCDGEEFLERTVSSFTGPIIVVSSSIDARKAGKLIALGARATINKSASWKADLEPYLYALKLKV